MTFRMRTAAHDFYGTTPFLVEFEPPDLDLGVDRRGKKIKIAMKTQCRSSDVDESRFIQDLPPAEEISLGQDAAASLKFDLTPVIGSLEYHLTIGLGLELDNDETAVLA